ncbi:MAG: alkaline phosphatase family protein [Ferruginibacter sp.]|nr:alkaline phosphatase family protein [Ferruginibacter sp.]
MPRRSFLLFTFYLFTATAFAQNPKPKLVVGLVVDQMRWDYLYRFNALYGDGGFRRLLKEGFSSENNLIPYMPTYTAVGHTTIYTGSVPAFSGIVGNNWFDKTTGRGVYCTDDSTVLTVGNPGSRAGKMSPANMWVTTVGDELRLSNNFKSKVIGIALKDRGAILPAGHSANAAYWYDAGKWITSTHYVAVLPTWVDQFNAKDLAAKYMSQDWNTLLPMNQYYLSTEDNKPYEGAIKGESTVTFPHRLSAIPDSSKYESFRTTPFANTFTFDFAKAAIENESLGQNTVTDFLAVSISSTDYIGHAFGPNSVEIEDTYLRLDKDIADFLQYLDARLGKGNYTFFLSADHAVAHIPAFLAEHKIPGGNFEDADIRRELNQMIEKDFGVRNAVQSLQNYQVYLNSNELERQGKDIDAVKKAVIKTLKAKPFIIAAFETDKLMLTTLPEPQKTMMINGFNPKRSGDIQFTLKPGYFDGGVKGTTHGLWNPYDAHIPCVFFGWGVKKGKTSRETYMTDIAPTIAALLQIQMPSGSVGKVITELIK